MEKSKIFEMAIRELTETAINKRKETLEDNELQLYTEVRLSALRLVILSKCYRRNSRKSLPITLKKPI